MVLQFLRDESAATAIEYGLIATGIAVAIIAVLKGVGTKLNTIHKCTDGTEIVGLAQEPLGSHRAAFFIQRREELV
jgi:pilus assembly protein Flp/PilA